MAVDGSVALRWVSHEELYTGWPLVWKTSKTWKCQGIWNMSGKCQGCCYQSGNCQGNVREKILSWKSVPKLFVTRWILAFPTKTVHSYILISSFIIINYEIIVNLIVWSFTLKLVLQACYEYHLTWAWVPHIVREMSGNFSVWRVVTMCLMPQISIHRSWVWCVLLSWSGLASWSLASLVLFPSTFPSRAVLNSEFPRSIWPIQFLCLTRIAFISDCCSPTVSRTCIFVSWSLQLIFLQIHISNASNLLMSSLSVHVCCIHSHAPHQNFHHSFLKSFRELSSE